MQQQIRESEVMVYAIGIDGDGETTVRRRASARACRFRCVFPFPGRGRGGWPRRSRRFRGLRAADRNAPSDERVNVVALRDMTDDSGGRTGIIRPSSGLDPATAGIADELSRQYYLGYAASGKRDGRWHSIRVEVRKGNYHVRARRGYIAG